MIPDEAIEAAVDALVGSTLGDRHGINGEEFVEAARAALEASAPYMRQTSSDDLEEVEERVKLIVQDVAMTVDYTPRLYDAVQEIMAVTLRKGL